MFQPSLTGRMCPALHPRWFLVVGALTSDRHSPPVWPEISVHCKHVQCLFRDLIASSSRRCARRYLLGHALIKMTSTGGAAKRFLPSTDSRGPPALHNKESLKSEFRRHDRSYKKGKIRTCQQLPSLLSPVATPNDKADISHQSLKGIPHKSSGRRCGSTLATMLCHLGHAQRHGFTCRCMITVRTVHDSMRAGHHECV